MLRTPIGRLRAIGLTEAVSFLVLLGVAMPLKYLADRPQAVTVVGWAHGVLFVGYGLAVLAARRAQGWSLKRAAGLMFAALVPFGPFVVDPGLRREERATADRPSR